MNRKEIKKEAKNIIKGNKFILFWPVFLIFLILIFSMIMFYIPIALSVENVENNTNIIIFSVFGFILVTIICLIANISYYNYALDYIKNERIDYSKILDCMKNKGFKIFISVITIFFIILIPLCLIIPGVILLLGYQMTFFILIDSDLGIKDSLKESRHLTKKYRFNYLIFKLGFIGWDILSILTLGILNIWLVPYKRISNVLYYQKLKAIPRDEDFKDENQKEK